MGLINFPLSRFSAPSCSTCR